MNLGNDKAFILFVEFFGNFPTPKETFLKKYIYNMFVKEKRENILQSFGGIFHFQHGIFKFSYLFNYLFNLFI